jgi:hypothetical protein
LSAEEKVDILESERSMDEDLSVLSIISVSSAVERILFETDLSLRVVRKELRG